MRLIITMLFSLVFLCVCSIPNTDLFPEYRNVNLIQEQRFNSGLWQEAQADIYLVFTEVNATEINSSTGLPPNYDQNDCYRLEAINLLPNGDFEETPEQNISGTWYWQSTHPASDEIEVISGTYGIIGKSLRFTTSANHTIRFCLNDPVYGLLDDFNQSGNYAIHFEYRTWSFFYFTYHVGINSSDLIIDWNKFTGVLPLGEAESNSSQINNVLSFPILEQNSNRKANDIGVQDFNGSYSNYYLSFGRLESSPVQTGVVDSFKVGRTDVPNEIRLMVPLVQPPRPDLVSGIYRFSFYIKQDTVNANRFPAQYVTFGMRHLSNQQIVLEKTVTLPVSQVWTKVSAVNSPSFQFNLNPQADNQIQCFICPMNTTQSDTKEPGSLLICHPSLELLPDGK